MIEGHDAIDIDDAGTWPDASREWVERVAHRLAGSTDHLLDLSISAADEDQFRLTLGPRRVLAYHCTRLLPHEVDDIRERGLRPLTKQLVHDRILAADARGLLTDTERQRARSGNVFTISNEASRTDRTCLVVGRTAFDEIPDGLTPFLRYWGGEAVRGGATEEALLATIGRPTIILASLDLTRPHDDPYSWPPLAKVFVGAVLALERRFAEVHYRCPIGPRAIHAFWQPGDAEYNRHRQLPNDI